MILTCEIHRGQMEDRPRQYPSDTSDAQWAVIEPSRPPVNTGGRRGKHPRRAVVDATLERSATSRTSSFSSAGRPCWRGWVFRFVARSSPGRDAAATGSAPDLW